jgi:hypothetical protein
MPQIIVPNFTVKRCTTRMEMKPRAAIDKTLGRR